MSISRAKGLIEYVLYGVYSLQVLQQSQWKLQT